MFLINILHQIFLFFFCYSYKQPCITKIVILIIQGVPIAQDPQNTLGSLLWLFLIHVYISTWVLNYLNRLFSAKLIWLAQKKFWNSSQSTLYWLRNGMQSIYLQDIMSKKGKHLYIFFFLALTKQIHLYIIIYKINK